MTGPEKKYLVMFSKNNYQNGIFGKKKLQSALIAFIIAAGVSIMIVSFFRPKNKNNELITKIDKNLDSESINNSSNVIDNFQKSDLILNFGFGKPVSKILNTGEKAYLFKNDKGVLIQLIASNDKINKYTLMSGLNYSNSSSKAEIMSSMVVSGFVYEATRGNVRYADVNSKIDIALKEEHCYSKLLNYNFDIVAIQLPEENRSLGLLTISVTESSKKNINSKSTIQNGLILDLQKGTFNGMSIKNSLKSSDIIKIMGQQPEDKEYGVYSYYKKGIEFMINEKKKYSCLGVSIFLEDTVQKEFLGSRTWTYKAFKGKIVPLEINEDIHGVKSKLGKPDDLITDSFDSSPRLTYKNSYGTINIYFDKYSGIVDHVDIFID